MFDVLIFEICLVCILVWFARRISPGRVLFFCILSALFGVVLLSVSEGKRKTCGWEVGFGWAYPSVGGAGGCRLEMPPVGIEAEGFLGFAVHGGQPVRILSLSGRAVGSVSELRRVLGELPDEGGVKLSLVYWDQRITVPVSARWAKSSLEEKLGLVRCSRVLNGRDGKLIVQFSRDLEHCNLDVARPYLLGKGFESLNSANALAAGFVVGLPFYSGPFDFLKATLGSLWRMATFGGDPLGRIRVVVSRIHEPWYLLPMKRFWDLGYWLFRFIYILILFCMAWAGLLVSMRALISRESLAYKWLPFVAGAWSLILILADTWYVMPS